MADEQDDKQRTNRPAFSAPLYAALRQGMKEISQVLPAFPDSVRTVDEPGTLGVPTQAEVTAEKGTVYGFHNMLNDYAARGGQDRGQKDKEIER